MSKTISPIRLLAVDDSALDTRYLEMFIRIKRLPVSAHFENNPESALSYLAGLPSKDFPEVIFVDIHMPLMTGFEFIDSYAETLHSRGLRPLLFITSASIQIADRERAERHPLITGFIEKPLTQEFFQQFIYVPLRGNGH